MLHYHTIAPATLELLKKIQKEPLFNQLRLVGGTALALQIGHRTSVDLDFFGNLEIDQFEILSCLNSLGLVKTLQTTNNIHIFSIDGIKVDFVNYQYPWLENAVITDDVLMAGRLDIAAMKLSAITGRGSKKDFIDIFFLLQEFTLKELIACYEKKYHDGSAFLVLRSLSYFDDADEEPEYNLFSKVTWKQIKSELLKKLLAFEKES